VLNPTVLNRRVLPVFVACLFALTACGSPSASPTPNSTAVPTAAATAAPSASPSATPVVQTSLDGITVTGKPHKLPKVSFTKVFSIDKSRVKVLTAGTGSVVSEASLVTVDYVGVNGRDGKVFDSSFARKATATFAVSGVVAGFKAGLLGQKVGSRLLMAMPGSDSYDGVDASYRPTDYQDGDTLIFVVDLLGASATQPSGTTVKPAAGLPTVAGDAATKPTVTMPGTAAPTKMAAQTLIQGKGAKVAKADTIYVRYVAYSWKTGKQIEDQWTPTTAQLSTLISGWKSGLTGKTVGSRVLLVLPPHDGGYPLGNNNPPLDAGDTIVYVVDILYSYKA
jgi:peptidylprolyl isomerase